MIHFNFTLLISVLVGSLFCTSTFAENISTRPSISLNDAQRESIKKLLISKKGMLGDEVHNRFTDYMVKNAQAQIKLPANFWKWLSSHKDIKQGLMAARYPMDQASIKRLAQFYGGIDKALVEKYSHLLLGACLKHDEEKGKSKNTLSDNEINEDVESVIAYMNKNNQSLIDIASDVTALSKAVKLNTPEKLISRNLLNSVALKTGVYPSVYRTSRLESLQFLIKNQEKKIEITPAAAFVKKSTSSRFKRNYSWPMFPLEKPAWLLYIDLGGQFDLKEANAVWARFLKGEGIIRYKGYGSKWKTPEYLYRKSDWNPQSIWRIIEDGGVCGRQARLARVTDGFFGIPSSRMPQPGHAAVSTYGYDKSQDVFYSYRQQSVKSLKDSNILWPFGKVPQGIRVKSKVGDFVGIEYRMGLALAANKNLDGYVKSRLALHLCRTLDGLTDAQRIQVLEKALNKSPYNTEVIYSLAAAYGSDLKKVNALIGKLRGLAGNIGNIDFETSKSTNTDFEKIKPVKVDKSDRVKNNMIEWSLLLCHNILQHAYSQKGLDKSNRKNGLEFLENELAYQKSIKRSPYLSDVETLILNFRMQQNDLEAVKLEIIQKFQPIIKKLKIIKKDKLKSLFKQLSVPLSYMKDNKERADYLNAFRKSFKESMILIKNKKTGEVSVNALYQIIFVNEVKYLKRSGKQYKKEAAELNDAYKKLLSK